MRCGKKSKTLLLVCSLCWLLSSALCSAQSYDGPELPEGWYPIHETELTELDEILTEQETQLTTLQTTLTAARQELTLALESLETSGAALTEAAVSLTELGRAAGRLRSLCILLGVTTGAGVLFAAFTLFGNAPVIGD